MQMAAHFHLRANLKLPQRTTSSLAFNLFISPDN